MLPATAPGSLRRRARFFRRRASAETTIPACRSALHPVGLNERLLDWGHRLGVRAFDARDAPPVGVVDQRQAGVHGKAVEKDVQAPQRPVRSRSWFRQAQLSRSASASVVGARRPRSAPGRSPGSRRAGRFRRRLLPGLVGERRRAAGRRGDAVVAIPSGVRGASRLSMCRPYVPPACGRTISPAAARLSVDRRASGDLSFPVGVV